VVVSAQPVAAQSQVSGWGLLYAELDWTTDYKFYGLSESNRQPAFQGVLHWVGPDNFYAGVFASQVRFNDFRNTHYEIDFYGGRHFYWDANDLNLELLYAMYPGTSGRAFYRPGFVFPTYNFIEPSVALDHRIGAATLSGKLVWSPNGSSHSSELGSVNGGAAYAFNSWLSASANAGHQWAEHGSNRSHWDLGATALWQHSEQRWSFDVRYYGTDVSEAHCFHTNWCEPEVVVKVGYGTVL
jgi:uncharacterized protein (TIGR02001 family)